MHINSQIHFNYTLNKSDLSIKKCSVLVELLNTRTNLKKIIINITQRLTTAYENKQKKPTVQQNEHKISTCPKGHLEE